MANKQDLNGALSTDEVTKALGMESLTGRTWFVQGTSAKTGLSLEEGLNWMAYILLKNK
jgi:signal recognition particle receptor subunit beta